MKCSTVKLPIVLGLYHLPKLRIEEIEELIKLNKYRKYKEYTPKSELDEMKTAKYELEELDNLDISYNELVANDISGDTIKYLEDNETNLSYIGDGKDKPRIRPSKIIITSTLSFGYTLIQPKQTPKSLGLTY